MRGERGGVRVEGGLVTTKWVKVSWCKFTRIVQMMQELGGGEGETGGGSVRCQGRRRRRKAALSGK